VIEIRAEDSSTIQRLAGRLMCPACGEIYNSMTRMPVRDGICDACEKTLMRRSDDRGDLIVERFKAYWEATFPLVEHYRKSGCYYKVDGQRPIAEVSQDIRKIVECEGR